MCLRNRSNLFILVIPKFRVNQCGRRTIGEKKLLQEGFQLPLNLFTLNVIILNKFGKRLSKEGVLVLSYDVIIIGGGPGGYVAAIRAAQLGAKVCVVEKDNLGGTCLNRGCIPTKALVASASLLSQIKQASKFGITIDGFSIDFPRIMERKNEIVAGLVQGIEFLFKRHKVQKISGTGKIIQSGVVEVTDSEGNVDQISGSNIIIATGSEPALISSLGYTGTTVITSNEALESNEIPDSLLVIGEVSLDEFATIFHEMGTKVTVVEALATILPMVDQEISRRLQSILKKKGIQTKTKTMIKSVSTDNGGIVATLESGEEIRAQKALISIGRTFNTKGLGLENVGIATGPKGEILVDDYLRTNIPGIYAIGDVTNKIQLAHVASAQGLVAVDNIMGRERKMDYRVVPNCIFTMPEVGSVGLTTQEAEQQGRKTKAGKFPCRPGKARCIRRRMALLKSLSMQRRIKYWRTHSRPSCHRPDCRSFFSNGTGSYCRRHC